jgi:hypothetical protein
MQPNELGLYDAACLPWQRMKLNCDSHQDKLTLVNKCFLQPAKYLINIYFYIQDNVEII